MVEGVLLLFSWSHICHFLVKSCSRMAGEYPFFRDTLIVRNPVSMKEGNAMFSMVMGLILTSVIGLIISAEVSVE
ncbi:hypothetical protein CN378_14950 [Bacillus sp. AFS015802]|nr:hypothetical protein CN378_14950 [Bacillus sp. AFS015802]